MQLQDFYLISASGSGICTIYESLPTYTSETTANEAFTAPDSSMHVFGHQLELCQLAGLAHQMCLSDYF